MNPQLDLFSTRTFKNELFGAEYTTIRPFCPLDNGPIDFIVKESKDYYYLWEAVLSLKVNIVNADGSAVIAQDSKDNVALVNNSMHSVFNDVIIMIIGKPIAGVPDSLYPYKSYFSNLFKYSKDSQVQ